MSFAVPAAADPLVLTLRSRAVDASGQEIIEEKKAPWESKRTALIVCDMWDDHWCKNAARRCEAMVPKMEAVIQAARKRGVTIIHAPSECMDFYKDAPQRKRMAEITRVEMPKPLDLKDVPLPVDSKEGGCDDDKPDREHRVWTRQHKGLTIADDDLISDKGDEVYSLLKERGIKNLIVCGVHTNMCCLNRPFAIKQMTRWGVRCMLIRDLTDAMYDPRKAPFVGHEEGTDLVIQHIEKHWCPTVLSKDLKP